VRRLGLLIFLVGCSSSPTSPDASVAFDYSATAEWLSQATPDVTSVTIDGTVLSSGATYTVDEMYTSFTDALASALSHPVVVTTSSGPLSFHLRMLSWPCGEPMTGAVAIQQRDHFALSTGLDGRLTFEAYDGSCHYSDGSTRQWATRTR
jgi:hypothetical protein